MCGWGEADGTKQALGVETKYLESAALSQSAKYIKDLVVFVAREIGDPCPDMRHDNPTTVV